ncbi:uncharacterized protein (DUF1800 family) [Actinoplanes campanulatus]|uniref:Uncharacterized protein (DUF1800 family) n=1 Tax=Actinoplanes campanulatus TaxID=113559 RepID=A0A7W5AQR1_9ACTN|nr:DUF1800 domain-containing protein [Actinoplanes campanulatus]MBB3100726.1 uncharacterized protein (DUF1800 family) [Actinoplanes campanulatus]GGN46031.1 hypothetical protein GCM10010109_80800 [Actinoplanes campanulatus]GID41212.1 hypothetical protein Aca09nite_77180 [Actinoplanes campanulatus]
MTDRRALSHLLRRLTFGPTSAEVDAAVRAGYDATLTGLLRSAPLPAPPDLGADPVARLPTGAGRDQRQAARREQSEQVTALTRWWLARMAGPGAAEKLTFFWHGHWATSVRKVRSAQLMLTQQQTLRRYGSGDTGPLVRAMVRDPALILWLDGQKNIRRAPNENLARELMELFTLGLGAYTENDVKAGARVLTGWQVDRATGVATLAPKRHDDRPVTLLGRTGAWDVDAYADQLVRHEAHLPFLAGRLWVRYAAATGPSADTVARIAAAGRNTTALLSALCRDPDFAATDGRQVKQPVEWLIGALRQLSVNVAGLGEQPQQRLMKILRGLGQVPLRPPSVGGWPAGEAWLTTATTLARLQAAQTVAALAPAAADRLTGADRIEALADLLVVNTWTAGTREALQSAKDPLRLLALGLSSPEYAVH